MISQKYSNHKIFIFLVWYIQLSKVFFIKSPKQLLFAVGFGLFSEFCSLVGSALPIKIILLMGSDSIPKYFPSFMMDFGKNNLIYLLTLASIFCWVLFIISELTSDKICQSSSKKLIIQSALKELSSRDREQAKKAYERYTKSISDLIFSLVAFITILFIYPAVAYVCLGYLIFFYLFLMLIFSIDHSKRVADTRQRILDWIPASSNIGFFAPFLFMIFDYTQGTSPGILYALISVILSRQLLRGHMRGLKSLNLLYSYKTRNIIETCYITKS